MNAPLPIFLQVATSQPTPSLTGSTSGSVNDAFADSLTAALAASTMTAAVPVQVQAAIPAETLVSSHDAGLAAALRRPGTATAGEAGPNQGGRMAGFAQSATGIDIGAKPEPEGPVMAPADGVVPAEGGRDIDATINAEAVTTAPSAGNLHAGLGRLDAPFPTIDGADAATHVASDRAQTVSIQAPGNQPHADLQPDLPKSHGIGDRPFAAAKSADPAPQPIQAHLQNDKALASLHRASRTVVKSVEPQEASPHVSSPADAALDRASQSESRPGLSMAIDRTEPALSSSLAGQDVLTAVRRAADLEPSGPLHPLVGTPAASADINASVGGSKATNGQVSGRMETILPGAGQPSGRHHAEPKSTRSTDPSSPAAGGGLTDPNRQAGSDLADGKPVRSTVSAIESGGKAAGTIANANHLAHPQMVEPNLPQSVGSTGVERIQPALPLDGAIDGIERFEPTSNLAPSKLAASTAQPTPGAQVALQIVRSLPNGVDRFTVHLQPAELGSVDIRLEFEGAGRMNAVITAERPETLELLQRDSRILERSLGDSGLKLASDGLSFALKQDQQQQQQGQSFHEQAQARETAFRAGRAYDDTPELEPMPSTMQVDRLRLLDIRT